MLGYYPPITDVKTSRKKLSAGAQQCCAVPHGAHWQKFWKTVRITWKSPRISKLGIGVINNKARYNQIDAKYRQMVFRSVPTNPYFESLVKPNWCKFRGLWTGFLGRVSFFWNIVCRHEARFLCIRMNTYFIVPWELCRWNSKQTLHISTTIEGKAY